MHRIWLIGLALAAAVAGVGCGTDDYYYRSGYYGAYGGTSYYTDPYDYDGRYAWGSRYTPGHNGYGYAAPYTYRRPHVYDGRVYRPGGPWARPPVVVAPRYGYARPGHVDPRWRRDRHHDD